MAIKVTVVDDEKPDEIEECDLEEVGYVVLTGPSHEVAHMQTFSNGTVQFTIKRTQ